MREVNDDDDEDNITGEESDVNEMRESFDALNVICGLRERKKEKIRASYSLTMNK